MSKVNTVVHTETSGEDDVHAGDHVDGDVPEVEGPDHIHQGEHDAGHHHQTKVEVSQHDESHDSYGEKGKAKVPPELERDDGVSFPSLVNLNTEHLIEKTCWSTDW